MRSSSPIMRSSPHIIRSAYHHFLQRLRLTLGDMYTNQVPQNHKNGSESGPGGPVWAQTLSERRPEPQDHVASRPGPKNPIQEKKTNTFQGVTGFANQNSQ